MKNGWTFILCWMALTTSGLAQGTPRDDYIRLDPEKTVLPEACGECHRSEFTLWKSTPHAQGYDELHRKEAALKIAENMGFNLIKRESLCLKCHYTPVIRRDDLRAAAGVSCESCHGAARDWMNVHNVFGIGERDFQKARREETPAHREERRRKSEAAGMLRPSDLYAVASNCFQCHTVPHEELVNTGRHSTGSADFELLAWTEKIRHNFLESFLTADGSTNAERTTERKRVVYFVGKALDLEYSLRGLALANDNGRYQMAMTRRIRNAVRDMRAIAAATQLPQAQSMLTTIQGVELKEGDGPSLLRAAEAIAQGTKSFLASQDGTQLARLDPLYLGTGTAVSDVAYEANTALTRSDYAPPDPDIPQPADSTRRSGVTPSEPRSVSAPAAARSVGADAFSSAAAADQPESVKEPLNSAGPIRTRPPWHETSRHKTIGSDQCASCHRHSDQDEWWIGDRHYASADPLLDGKKEYLQIARNYGIGPAAIRRGNQICMQCHGSIVSGKESQEVSIGAGCESCHGPGADFREPHQVKGSYQKALQLGMIALKDLTTRARRCARCHYITEPRLISAGHPTGAEFDFVAANQKIKHWQGDVPASQTLQEAYQGVMAQRGPLPSVTRGLVAKDDVDGRRYDQPAVSTRMPSGPETVSAAPTSSDDGAGRAMGSQKPQDPGPDPMTPSSVRRMPPRPPSPEKITVANDLFPEAVEQLTIHEWLLLIKKKLESLYQRSKVGSPEP